MLYPTRKYVQRFAVPWERSMPTSYSGFTCLGFPQPPCASHDTYTIADLEILKAFLKACFPRTSAWILINSAALTGGKKKKKDINFWEDPILKYAGYKQRKWQSHRARSWTYLGISLLCHHLLSLLECNNRCCGIKYAACIFQLLAISGLHQVPR